MRSNEKSSYEKRSLMTSCNIWFIRSLSGLNEQISSFKKIVSNYIDLNFTFWTHEWTLFMNILHVFIYLLWKFPTDVSNFVVSHWSQTIPAEIISAFARYHPTAVFVDFLPATRTRVYFQKETFIFVNWYTTCTF